MLNTVYTDLKPITEEHGGLLLNSIYKKQKVNPTKEEKAKLLQSQMTNDDLDVTNETDDILQKVHQSGKQKKLSFEDMLSTNSDLDEQQETGKSHSLSGIEDSRYTKFYHQKYMRIEISSSIFATSSIAFSIIEYDMRVKKPEDNFSDLLLTLVSCMTVILMVIIVISYYIELRLMKEQKIVTERDTLVSTGKIVNLLLELFILIFHPNNSTHDVDVVVQNKLNKEHITYKLNDFFGIIILLRMYIIIRVMLNSTMYASTRAFRICRMYGTDGGFFYAAKCLMDQKPLKTITVLFILSLLMLGHGLRVCEEPMKLQISDYGQNFGQYWNCFWCIIITMTTVGYGDYFPATLPGRLVIFVTAIWGVFLVSMMVVALNNTLKMEISESKTYNVIQRLRVRKKLQEQSAWVLTSATKFSLMNKKGKLTKDQYRQKISEIKNHTESFKIVNRKIKRMYDVSNIIEEVARHFDFLKDELKFISDNQLLLKDYLLKLKSTGTINNNEINEQQNFLKQFKDEVKPEPPKNYV